MPAATATWGYRKLSPGEVGITADAISVNGDSGAPVTANGHVVAHLVGGAPHDYSVVQDVEYQLAQIDADPI